VNLNTRREINPVTTSWVLPVTFNAPAGRTLTTAVWTVSETIYGADLSGPYLLEPAGDTIPAPTFDTLPAPPRARSPILHTAVWTGIEIDSSGADSAAAFFNTAGYYNPRHR